MYESYSPRFRKARFAGSWYEADPLLLEKQLDQFLKKAAAAFEKKEKGADVRAIVVPHAGYFYSGAAAASSFYAARKTTVKRVILLGPSHYKAFHGIALSTATAFETPLGAITLDQKTGDLLKQYSLFFEDNEAHELEHSLEMQLPFIKKIFGEVLLLPLLVGSLKDQEEIVKVTSLLKSFLEEGDLLIVSSDFIHYGPRFHYVPFRTHVQEKIKQLDERAYHFLEQRDLAGFLHFQKETHSTICGMYPLAMLLGLLPEESTASRVAYYTSQEVTSADPEHSVSYMGITFSS